MLEDGSWKTEAGSWKTEAGSRKLEDGRSWLDVRSFKLPYCVSLFVIVKTSSDSWGVEV